MSVAPPIHWFYDETCHCPLVLLHGFTGSPRNWEVVVQALPRARAVAALALPGHHPAAPVASDFEANVDWLAGVLERAGLAGCHLVGYSLGARAALGLALRHAHLPTRLTLIGVHPGLDSPSDRILRMDSDRTWIELLRTRGIEAFVDAWERHPLFDTQEQLPLGVRARQRAVRLAHAPEGLARSLEYMGLGAMPCYRPRLSELSIPVTLITGTRDRKFTGLAQSMASSLPCARVEQIADSGHNLLLETPTRLANILSNISV